MSINRVRKITLPDGTGAFDIPPSLVLSSLPEPSGLNTFQPVAVDGSDVQSSTGRTFGFSVAGWLTGVDHVDLRAQLTAIDAAMGDRNRRFYINDDRYWFVRYGGMTLSNLKNRSIQVFVTLDFTVMDPYVWSEFGRTNQRMW